MASTPICFLSLPPPAERLQNNMKILETIYQRSPVPVQTVLLNLKAAELYFERYGKKFQHLFQKFDQNQWLPASHLAAYQDEQLRRLIREAYRSVPYYSDLMRSLKIHPDDIKTKDDLFKLPILTKEDIRRNASKLLSTTYPKLLLRHGHTSGTTGSPLDFHYDIDTCVIHHVVDWRYKGVAGLTYGEPYASLLGRVIVPVGQSKPPFWRWNYVNNQLFLSSFHLKRKNLPSYFDALLSSKIQALEAYPSTAYILALYLLETQQTFPLRCVFTSSETLFDYQREAIEKAFACKIFDAYGMAERAIFATECEQHSGHHLNSDYGITEFLDSRGEPAGEAKIATIVATSLHNYAMPFIRYQTNDASAHVGAPCACGRGFPLMHSVATKQESIVTLPDGRLISPSVLTHPFKPMHNIAESQIIQERVDELLVNIVKRESYSSKDEAMLISGFHERLGRDVKIKIRYVDEIPRTANAKFKWVISRIAPRFNRAQEL
jgi:phenylacetate-coenzyme A ligase PaaK-like adenylate-forming protein